MNSAFQRFIGIDYSGAQTAETSLPGLRIYEAERSNQPQEIVPQPSPRKHWTRKEIAEWLAFQLSQNNAALVGIDHAFSFPLQYFEKYVLRLCWSSFLDDFQSHWPTDRPNTYVDFIRDGVCGNGSARCGSSRWRRLSEIRSRTAKSVFHFDVPGAVAKSTHAGIPWLRYLRQQLGNRIHFWPFDGWTPPPGVSVIAEVYPALWSKTIPSADRNQHQQDAFCIAEWLRRADLQGTLDGFFSPELDDAQRKVAEVEGWILGVM